MARPSLRGLTALLCSCLASATVQADCHPAPPQTRPVGSGVYELAYSPSQHALYAAVSGGFSPEALPSRIARLDPDTLRESAGILLPYKAFGLALDDSTGRLYVGHSVDGRVTVLNTRNNRRMAEIVLSQPRADGKRYEHDIRSLVIDPSTRRLFVPGLAAGHSVLFVIGLDSLALEATVEGFGFYPTGLALDAAGHRLFVSSMDGDIRVMGTRSLAVNQRWTHTGIGQPVNLAYDALVDRLYVIDQGMPKIREWQQRLKPDFQPTHPGNRLLALHSRTGDILAETALDAHPLAVQADPERQRLYVTERDAGTVAVLDSRTLQVLHRWPAGKLANSLAYDPTGQRLWVSVQHTPSSSAPPRDDSISRICLTADDKKRAGSAPPP